ncbi:tetratricopeptide repeat protein [Asaia prunellae]|uniref:tetratricopeptide repeat protein n=1 Tax=Asaia prunellae TaxID=610245 RepID=UPI0004718503|nr:tetratricopeptide repeat protein [Asaia prunellae]
MLKLFHNAVFGQRRRQSISHADNARDNGDPAQAAVLYKAVVDRWGETPGLLMQLGNALKDSEAFDEAEVIYQRVWDGPARNADVALQFGHLMKTRGDLQKALEWYQRSISIDQADDNPAHAEHASLEAFLRGVPGSDDLEAEDLEVVKTHHESPTIERVMHPTDSTNFRDQMILRQLHLKLKFRRA